MKVSSIWTLCLVMLSLLSTAELHSNDRMHNMKGRVRKRNSRKLSFRSHRNTHPFCQFNTTLIENADILLRTVEQSKYIFTGKVLNVRHAPRIPNTGRRKDQHIYKIFIRRVIKGELNDLSDVHFEATRKKSFNGATVFVTRERKPGEQCEPSPRVRYSAIFLADRTDDDDDDFEDEDESYNDERRPSSGGLTLVVDPIPLSLYHLDRINAAVKGM